MTATTNKATEETQIRRLLEDWTKALRARDVDGLMSYYAPDVMVFGITPPLQYRGADANRKHWEQMFASFPTTMGYEVRDLSITMADDVAFSHCINRFTETTKDGATEGNWVRATVCYRKINGRWMVTHEHVSVPFDFESGKALLDLKP